MLRKNNSLIYQNNRQSKIQSFLRAYFFSKTILFPQILFFIFAVRFDVQARPCHQIQIPPSGISVKSDAKKPGSIQVLDKPVMSGSRLLPKLIENQLNAIIGYQLLEEQLRRINSDVGFKRDAVVSAVRNQFQSVVNASMGKETKVKFEILPAEIPLAVEPIWRAMVQAYLRKQKKEGRRVPDSLANELSKDEFDLTMNLLESLIATELVRNIDYSSLDGDGQRVHLHSKAARNEIMARVPASLSEIARQPNLISDSLYRQQDSQKHALESLGRVETFFRSSKLYPFVGEILESSLDMSESEMNQRFLMFKAKSIVNSWFQNLRPTLSREADHQWTNALNSELKNPPQLDALSKKFMASVQQELVPAIARIHVAGDMRLSFDKADAGSGRTLDQEISRPVTGPILEDMGSGNVGYTLHDALVYYSPAVQTLVATRPKREALSSGPTVLFWHGDSSAKSTLQSWVKVFGKVARYFLNPWAVDFSIMGPFPQEKTLVGFAKRIRNVVNAIHRECCVRADGQVSPLIIYGRSMGSTRAYLYALVSHLKGWANREVFTVLSSSTLPHRIEEEAKVKRRQAAAGMVEGFVEASLKSAEVFAGKIQAQYLNFWNDISHNSKGSRNLERFGDDILIQQGTADADAGPSAKSDILEFRRKHLPLGHVYILENPILEKVARLYGASSKEYKDFFDALTLVDPNKIEASHFLLSNRERASIREIREALVEQGVSETFLDSLDLTEKDAAEMRLLFLQVVSSLYSMMDYIRTSPSADPKMQAKSVEMATYLEGLKNQYLNEIYEMAIDAIKFYFGRKKSDVKKNEKASLNLERAGYSDEILALVELYTSEDAKLLVKDHPHSVVSEHMYNISRILLSTQGDLQNELVSATTRDFRYYPLESFFRRVLATSTLRREDIGSMNSSFFEIFIRKLNYKMQDIQNASPDDRSELGVLKKDLVYWIKEKEESEQRLRHLNLLKTGGFSQ